MLLKKYGIENFSKKVLYEFDSIKEAYLKENEIVNKDFIQRPDTYNLAIGGSWSVDYKLKAYPRGEKHCFYGKHHTHESNAKRSQTLKETNLSLEVKKRRSDGGKKAALSRKESGYVMWNKGKQLTNEDKLRKSKAALQKEKLQCPYCKRMIEPGNAKRWHFDNCKLKLVN